jgi:Zn-dependent alcohol dehydrogenase
MKSRAAVLIEGPGQWNTVEIDVDEPRDHEVLLRIVTSGICHSDDHHATGDLSTGHFPYCGGHEGAAVVEAVGPGVRGLAVGDHVVTSFIPGCGRCIWCANGQQNLCDMGAALTMGTLPDGT